MRGRYLVLVGDQAELGGPIATELAAGGWSPALQRPGLQVFGRDGALAAQAIGARGVLIGEVHPRPDAEHGGFHDAAVHPTCHKLLKRIWGRYVAIFVEPGGAAAFRDPSGALECITWRLGDLTVMTSADLDDLPAPIRPSLSVDWDAVGDLLIDRTRAAGRLALRGVEAAPAGSLVRWVGQRLEAELLWRPSKFARRPLIDDGAAKVAMRDYLDVCVGQLLADGAPALVEVSGGLDSAIVALAVRAHGAGAVRVWLNNRSEDPRGDERRYARAVAETGGFPLTEALKPMTPLEGQAWRALGCGWRPPLSGLDVPRDAFFSELCAARGIERIFTGQGGDMVFFQEPTSAILSDHLRLGGSWRQVPSLADGLAAWTRRSGWRTLGQAIAGAAFPKPLRIAPPSFLHAKRPILAGGDHPWLIDAAELPPGKRFQVFSLLACQAFNTPSLREKVADIRHPLLAQPLVELCLRLTTPQLTQCLGDRWLARAAFAHRLPQEVAQRRSKGDLSRYYGQLVAASLPYLRALLLDGILAKRQILDAKALEAVLSSEHLIVHAPYAEILEAALIETWASAWQARLAAT